MEIGPKILQLLDSKRLTKKAFTERMEISRQTLNNWEKGVTAPNTEDLKKMAKILDVDVTELSAHGTAVKKEVGDAANFYRDKLVESLENTVNYLRDENVKLHDLVKELISKIPSMGSKVAK